MVRAERYVVEICLALNSAWGAWALWHPPSNFAAYQGTFLFIAELDPNEHHWAALLTVACLLKLFGLVVCLKFHWHLLGLRCRAAGLLMSAFFWTGLGFSAILGNPDTLVAGMPVILWGASAVWALLRYPWMPGRPE